MKRHLSLMLVFMMLFNLITPAMAATGTKYKVTVSKTTGGTVSGAGSYYEGDEVTITAKDKTGYDFVRWTNVSGIELDDETEPEVTFEMPGNKVSMKATFTKVPTLFESNMDL